MVKLAERARPGAEQASLAAAFRIVPGQVGRAESVCSRTGALRKPHRAIGARGRAFIRCAASVW